MVRPTRGDWLHLIDPELVAVGPGHVLEVVVAQAGHGARSGVVGEERGIGRGLPLGLVTRIGTADALVQIGHESADNRVALIQRRIARLAPGDAVATCTACLTGEDMPIEMAMEPAAGRARRLLDLSILLSLWGFVRIPPFRRRRRLLRLRFGLGRSRSGWGIARRLDPRSSGRGIRTRRLRAGRRGSQGVQGLSHERVGSQRCCLGGALEGRFWFRHLVYRRVGRRRLGTRRLPSAFLGSLAFDRGCGIRSDHRGPGADRR